MNFLSVLLAASFSGCTFDEKLNSHDITGTVKIPIAAATFTLGLEEEAESVTDQRALGPVYLGVYASLDEGLYPFSHPEMGPILSEGSDGNAYPYAGTTIGRFDWGCYEQTVCKVVTGRYKDYDDVLGFFNEILDEEIVTFDGHRVSSGVEYQERCFEYDYSTGDWEMLFIGEEDFTVETDASGQEYLVAQVTIPHSPHIDNMVVWGWMDMPSPSFAFNTCDPGEGPNVNYYNEFYPRGTNSIDVLNYPGKYIDYGDWVSTDGAVITDPESDFTLVLDYNFVDDEL